MRAAGEGVLAALRSRVDGLAKTLDGLQERHAKDVAARDARIEHLEQQVQAANDLLLRLAFLVYYLDTHHREGTHGRGADSEDTAVALTHDGYWRLQEELRRKLGVVAQTPEGRVLYGLRPGLADLVARPRLLSR